MSAAVSPGPAPGVVMDVHTWSKKVGAGRVAVAVEMSGVGAEAGESGIPDETLCAEVVS